MKLLHCTIIGAAALSMCHDTQAEEWSDVNGRSCDLYRTELLCRDGSYGPGWRFDLDGTFLNYKNVDGIHAGDRCCECIPSTSHTFSHLGCSPRSVPDSNIWYDAIGHTCQQYRQNGWCEFFGYGKLLSTV